LTGFDEYSAGSKNRHANKEIRAGRRTHVRIALGSWNELGAAGTHHFLFVALPHVHLSMSPFPLDLSFCTYRDGWLHNLEDVRATTLQKRGAARRGAARPQPRASVPAAHSRAVNFELVRDATAYVCPKCGTKCARSYRRNREREREKERERPPCRAARGLRRGLFSYAYRAAASFSAAITSRSSSWILSRRFCRREMCAKANLHGAVSIVYLERIVRVKKNVNPSLMH